MTFASDETSIQDSQPVELFAFTLGTTLVSLTNADEEVTIDVRTYLPASISRGQPTYSAEKPGSELQVQIAIADPNAAAIVQAFIPRPPSGLTSLAVIQRQPTGDRGFWSGKVVSSNYNDEILTLLCRPLSDINSKVAPRRGYGMLCQHMLFDNRCKVNVLDHREIGAVTAISSDGLTFTVPGIAAPTVRYDTGQIQLEGGFAQGMIISHSGDDFTVRYPIPEIEVDSNVVIVGGCNRDTTDCIAYSNIANFGGFPYTPVDRNPFEKGVDRT